jgi:hypothetical protein
MTQCLANIVYSGNGILSIKSILEKELVLGSYSRKNRNDEFERFIDDITEECMRSSKNYLNNNYRSTIYIDDEVPILRKISCEYIHTPDNVKNQYELLREDIRELFVYAINLNKDKESKK